MARTYVAIFCLFFFSGCVYDPPAKYGIDIYNNSDSDIFVDISCTDSLDCLYKMKIFDTIHLKGKSNVVSPSYRVPKRMVKPAIMINDKYVFDRCANGILNIVVISEKTMYERTWEDICKYKLFVKKIPVTFEQLERDSWVVEYTP